MRILITNDDGINAPGLAVMSEIAEALAGPDGEVWTVAPATEQSGVSHCLSYSRPFLLTELGPRRFAAEGYPADCVLAGLYHVLDSAPDLVLSGVNRGNNAGENTLYSGTIGGALEAALQGVPAVALSQFYGPANNALTDPFESARVHGAETVRRLLPLFKEDSSDYRLFFNVNFPPFPAAETKPAVVTTQGFRPDSHFSVTAQDSPTGRQFMWVRGGPQHGSAAPGTDIQTNLDGAISVTPMRADLTATHDMAATAQALSAP